MMPGSVKILDAAQMLFAAKGVDGVSIREIAQGAGISKATVFHHFENKDALYQAVVKRSCVASAAFLTQLVEREDGQPLAALADYRRLDLQEMSAHGDVTRLILRELMLGQDKLGRQLAEEVFGEQFLNLRSLIEKAQSSGDFKKEMDTGLAAASVVSINLFLFMVWPVLKHLPESPFVSMEAAAESMFLLLVNGMAGKASIQGDQS
ncbi:MAG: TetR/AcrR family transcriptional regulator [Mariprofundus sp.]|nr:TetR/AcrR family transcriptional regulator [Mariprofundus sp.]